MILPGRGGQAEFQEMKPVRRRFANFTLEKGIPDTQADFAGLPAMNSS
jgi:hypothetical protein